MAARDERLASKGKGVDAASGAGGGDDAARHDGGGGKRRRVEAEEDGGGSGGEVMRKMIRSFPQRAPLPDRLLELKGGGGSGVTDAPPAAGGAGHVVRAGKPAKRAAR